MQLKTPERLVFDPIAMKGLVPTLEQVLAELASELTVHPYANVIKGSRSVQIITAAAVPSFHVDLWHQGVEYGRGTTSKLSDVGQAIIQFLHQGASIAEMKANFSWFEAQAAGYAHERGVEEFLTQAWRRLEEFLSLAELGPHMRRLFPLVSEAASRPVLRQLLPYTSHELLCFSRTTGYPFTRDCPMACPTEGEHFTVLAHDGRTVLGRGSAAEAADLLIANLPPNCGSAVHGTADWPE